MPFSKNLSALFERSLDGILLTSPDGDIFAANPAACAMLDRTAEEICALGRKGVLRADSGLAHALEERARTGHFHGVVTMLRRDGSDFPADVASVLFVSNDGLQRTWIIFRDVTELQRAEAAQRAVVADLRAMIDNVPLAVQGISPDGIVTVWNSAAERLFGWTAAEVVGRPNTLVDATNEVEHQALRARVLAGEMLVGVGIYRRDKHGVQRELSLSTSALRSAEGQVVGILALFEDRAAQHSAERARARELQLEALRQLAVGIQHEMNNSLTALILELALFSKHTLSADDRTHLTEAEALCARLVATLQKLRRVEELQVVPYLGTTMMLDVSPNKAK